MNLTKFKIRYLALALFAFALLVASVVWIEIALGRYTTFERTSLPKVVTIVLLATLVLGCWRTCFLFSTQVRGIRKTLLSLSVLIAIQAGLFCYWSHSSGQEIRYAVFDITVSLTMCAASAVFMAFSIGAVLDNSPSS